MADRRVRHRVLAQLVCQRARQNVKEEIIDLRQQRRLGCEPIGAPERREDLDRRQHWTSAICELGWSREGGSRGPWVHRNYSDRLSNHHSILGSWMPPAQ